MTLGRIIFFILAAVFIGMVAHPKFGPLVYRKCVDLFRFLLSTEPYRKKSETLSATLKFDRIGGEIHSVLLTVNNSSEQSVRLTEMTLFLVSPYWLFSLFGPLDRLSQTLPIKALEALPVDLAPHQTRDFVLASQHRSSELDYGQIGLRSSNRFRTKLKVLNTTNAFEDWFGVYNISQVWAAVETRNGDIAESDWRQPPFD